MSTVKESKINILKTKLRIKENKEKSLDNSTSYLPLNSVRLFEKNYNKSEDVNANTLANNYMSYAETDTTTATANSSSFGKISSIDDQMINKTKHTKFDTTAKYKMDFKQTRVDERKGKSTCKLVKLVIPLDNELQISKKNKTDEMKEEIEETANDMNVVKSLDFWDKVNETQPFKAVRPGSKHNSVKGKKNTLTSIVANFVKENPESKIAELDEFQLINKKNEIRESMVKFQRKFCFPHLKNFYKKVDQEQGSILLQNINLTKRSFNFEGFKNKAKRNHPINKDEPAAQQTEEKVIENEFVQAGNQIKLKRKDDTEYKKEDDDEFMEKKVVKVEDPFLKCNDLKLEGNYELLISQDFYRKTVFEKKRVETSFRREMMRLSKLNYELKMQRQKLMTKNGELTNAIYKAKENHQMKTEAMEMWIKEVDRTIPKRFAALKAEFPYKNQNEIHFEFTAWFNKTQNLKQKEVNDALQDYETIKAKGNRVINYNSYNLIRIDEEIKKTKITLENLMKEQTNYYLDLLMKGIDVRNEGLCWIIRRLIELNAKFDANSFPKFLEASQVEYIISLSQKQIEAIQLKIILKVLKEKKQKMRGDREKLRLTGMTDISAFSGISSFFKNQEAFKNLSSESNTTFPFNLTQNNTTSDPKKTNGLILAEFTSGFYNRTLSKIVHKVLQNIYRKNQTNMKLSYEQRLEDLHVSLISYLLYFRLNQLFEI